jgi:endogenous inhibitor of DNA gyrase (YacG/DUF329 family)
MNCPICKSPVAEPTAKGERTSFPFCSERCKLIDLGRWLDGRYQVPVAPDDQDEATGSIYPDPAGGED